MIKTALRRTLSFVGGACIGMLLSNWWRNAPVQPEALITISVLTVVVFIVHLLLAYKEQF